MSVANANLKTLKKGQLMTVIATYPDFKTVEVFADLWHVDAIIESFLEAGAIFVTTK